MRTVVIAPPEPLVEWEELDRHLRLAGDETERLLVESLAAAASWHIDGPGGWMGRAIGPQTLEARFSSFACTDIDLPYPEIISITSVKFIDGDSPEDTMDAGDYSLAGRLLSPKWGKRWPSVRSQPEAIRVQYQAGYIDEVPPPIKAAVCLMVGDLFANRETVALGTTSSIPMSVTVENLLQPFKVYR